jgi:hypothetical protein
LTVNNKEENFTVERRGIFYLPMMITTCLFGCKRGKREKAIFMYHVVRKIPKKF